MSVRAKFKCTQVEKQPHGGASLAFEAVTQGSPENEEFFKFTPTGQLCLGTVNEEAIEQFEVGKEYYLDLSLAN